MSERYFILSKTGDIVPVKAYSNYGCKERFSFFLPTLHQAKAHALRLSDSSGETFRVLKADLVGSASPLPKSQFIEAPQQ